MDDNGAAVLLADDGSAVIQRYETVLVDNGFPVRRILSWRDLLKGDGNRGKKCLLIARQCGSSPLREGEEIPFPVICILSANDREGCPDFVYACLDENSSDPVIISTVRNGLRDLSLQDRLSDRDTYRELIDGMNESVWVIDMDGTIIDVNNKAVELLGFSREELLRRGLGLLDQNLSDEETGELRKRIPSERIQVFETVHTTREGRGIPVEISSSIISYHGKKAILSIARDIRERKDTEKVLREQLEKDELVVKAMHHRIKNNLATVSNLLTLQARISGNEEAKEVLQEAVARLQSISLLYNKLLETENFKGLSMAGYFGGIVNSLLEIYPEKKHLRIIWEMEDLFLSEKYLFPLGVIVDELMTNIFKYGFPGETGGRVEFTGFRDRTHFHLIIRNNGIPFPEESELDRKKGFGLMIVKLLSKQINGEYRHYRDDDTIQEISFPLE